MSAYAGVCRRDASDTHRQTPAESNRHMPAYVDVRRHMPAGAEQTKYKGNLSKKSALKKVIALWLHITVCIITLVLTVNAQYEISITGPHICI